MKLRSSFNVCRVRKLCVAGARRARRRAARERFASVGAADGYPSIRYHYRFAPGGWLGGGGINIGWCLPPPDMKIAYLVRRSGDENNNAKRRLTGLYGFSWQGACATSCPRAATAVARAGGAAVLAAGDSKRQQATAMDSKRQQDYCEKSLSDGDGWQSTTVQSDSVALGQTASPRNHPSKD